MTVVVVEPYRATLERGGLHWVAGGGCSRAINDGNTYVWPTITISGKVTSPTVSNQTTGEILALKYAATDSDTIVFITYNREVTLNGNSGIDNNLTSSQYWRLVPGLNELIFNTSNELILVWLSLRWYNGYTGVA